MSAWATTALLAAGLLAAGTGWLVLLRTRWECGPEWLGTALAAGGAWLAVLTALISPLEGAAIAPLLLAGLAAPLSFLLWRRPAASLTAARAGWLGFLPALAVVALSFWLAAQRPVWNVDAQKRWVLHGQWLAQEGSVTPQRVEDETWATTHPSYPPLVPAVIGTALLLGADKDTGIRPLFPLFLAALLGVLYGYARRQAGRRWAPWIAAAFALTPCFAYLDRWKGAIGLGSDAALAEVPQALYLAALAAALVQACRAPSRPTWGLAAVMAVGATLTKNEGAALAGLMLAVTAGYACLQGPARNGLLRGLLPAGGAWLVALAGWKLLARDMPVEVGEDYLSAGAVLGAFQNLDRLPVILERLLAELARVQVWGLLWLLPVAALASLVADRFRSRAGATNSGRTLLLLWLLAGTGLIVAAYLATGWKGGRYEALMEFSLTRLLMHHAPLAALLACHLRARNAP